VGSAVASKFKSEGFSVAVASRSLKPDEVKKDGYLGINLDMARPQDVARAFSQVENALGPASVVVYNVAAFAAAPGGRSDPLSLSFDEFSYGASVSGLNAYEVAVHANKGFEKLPDTLSRTFIATGNIMPWSAPPHMLGLSSGKKVLANVAESCAKAYGPAGKRFYYAYEVNDKGGPVMTPDPETHATVFYRLYGQGEQGVWDVRFTKGGDLWQPTAL